MAGVNVTYEMLGDTRFVRLGKMLGIDPDLARMKVVRVWHECQHRESHYLLPEEIDAAAGITDFGFRMRESELADAAEDGSQRLYIRGTKGRIEWLKTAREHARENGKLGGRPRRPTGIRKTKTGFAVKTKVGFGQETDSGLHVETNANSQSSSNSQRISEKTSEVSSHARTVTDHFVARYTERTGSKPTWAERHFANLKRILRDHTASEVCARIDVLFTSPPKFLAGGTPDFDTLVQHFDKLAPAKPTQVTQRKSLVARYADGEFDR